MKDIAHNQTDVRTIVTRVDNMAFQVSTKKVRVSISGESAEITHAEFVSLYKKCTKFLGKKADGAHTVWKDTSDSWKEIYLLKDRKLNFYKSGGKGTQSKLVSDTMPCHDCGLILPITMIQSDHHHPKSGGKSRAMTKVLRALGNGICKGSPTGQKGQFARDQPPGIPPTVAPHNHRGRSVTRDYGKFELELKGKLLLTLILEYMDKADPGRKSENFPDYCSNSFMNIVPKCPNCNGNKSNTYKQIR
ncbi:MULTISPECIES: hypothetical protein [Roseobacteraceae]|uniref:hypothetical protein n=1 Tax=Roseobacteraceae TaxID=2854170 RepID=UPI00405964F3